MNIYLGSCHDRGAGEQVGDWLPAVGLYVCTCVLTLVVFRLCCCGSRSGFVLAASFLIVVLRLLLCIFSKFDHERWQEIEKIRWRWRA